MCINKVVHAVNGVNGNVFIFVICAVCVLCRAGSGTFLLVRLSFCRFPVAFVLL